MKGAQLKTVLVRKLTADDHRKLKTQASASGMFLQDYIVAVLHRQATQTASIKVLQETGKK